LAGSDAEATLESLLERLFPTPVLKALGLLALLAFYLSSLTGFCLALLPVLAFGTNYLEGALVSLDLRWYEYQREHRLPWFVKGLVNVVWSPVYLLWPFWSIGALIALGAGGGPFVRECVAAWWKWLGSHFGW
jgi:hypothetical protein